MTPLAAMDEPGKTSAARSADGSCAGIEPLPRIGPGVVLRRLAVDDLRVFQSYRSDPQLARYQGWVPMSDDEATAFLVEMSSVALLEPGAWTQIAVDDLQTGRLVGDLGLYLAPDGRAAEIGFTLERRAQGRGLATQAVRTAIGLLFEQSRVERVVGITDARNAASVRLLERVGMQRTATRNTVFRGEPCVEHVYALVRGDA